MQYMIWKSKYLAEFLHSTELAEIAINLMLLEQYILHARCSFWCSA